MLIGKTSVKLIGEREERERTEVGRESTQTVVDGGNSTEC